MLPGQYFNKETNAHYNYYRDYDPAIGRYIQSDPIGLWGGLNSYASVGGNPLTYVDETGEVAWVAAGAAIGAAVNVSVTYAWNAYNGQPTTSAQLIAAATSGAIAGAYSALGGPVGGTVARWLGSRANSAIGLVSSGLFSAAGGYVGQVTANYIDPCNPADPLNAAIWAGVGSAAAGAVVPTPGLYTINQANHFQPTTFAAINRSPVVRSYGASAGIGAASVLGFPIASPPSTGCMCR